MSRPGISSHRFRVRIALVLLGWRRPLTPGDGRPALLVVADRAMNKTYVDEEALRDELILGDYRDRPK